LFTFSKSLKCDTLLSWPHGRKYHGGASSVDNCMYIKSPPKSKIVLKSNFRLC